ncbi:hypothetical protein QMK19_29210 [Streptomyces sp. H10-C2]|uniref:hypothetical protein n=1 Tax=unclassified Streptomyces TaxID=2593676 RepID=UPI0024BB148B|nr:MULTISPECIES: hypothetical protein [unclassified Streptomyces]MDJ0344199.1 hypothetical protein [Streptomyces sp. PH10-H1]MDJ0373629.1 hypothetical protein [Streptomyces sp. H10-C2]MDJ0383729.1 hypothetical protein [Streptomyces sp. G-G2]
MPSHASDPRHQRLVAVLPPLLARTCPPDGGGYGGAYELRLTGREVRELGGLDLLRSALRAAARSQGWTRVETYGTDTAVGEAVVGVVDRREAPGGFAEAVDRHRQKRMRTAVETVARNRAEGTRRTVPGSVVLAAQEFRAALADLG